MRPTFDRPKRCTNCARPTSTAPDDGASALPVAICKRRGVAARHPAYDKSAGAIVDLEARIDRCRTQRQNAPALARESEDLLALTAYVAYQSRGATPTSARRVAIGQRCPYDAARNDVPSARESNTVSVRVAGPGLDIAPVVATNGKREP